MRARPPRSSPAISSQRSSCSSRCPPPSCTGAPPPLTPPPPSEQRTQPTRQPCCRPSRLLTWRHSGLLLPAAAPDPSAAPAPAWIRAWPAVEGCGARAGRGRVTEVGAQGATVHTTTALVASRNLHGSTRKRQPMGTGTGCESKAGWSVTLQATKRQSQTAEHKPTRSNKQLQAAGGDLLLRCRPQS